MQLELLGRFLGIRRTVARRIRQLIRARTADNVMINHVGNFVVCRSIGPIIIDIIIDEEGILL